MNKKQIVFLTIFVLCFGILYMMFDTKPKAHQEVERQRAMMQTLYDLDAARTFAFGSLNKIGQDSVMYLEQTIDALSESNDREKLAEYQKKLSGYWFSQGYIELAGQHAEQVAIVENTAEAWSIAGTTWSYCAQRTQNTDLAKFCVERARASIESAISMDPENISYRINQSLLMVEHPDQTNPMLGITMLLQMVDDYPDDYRPIFHLGRLAFETNQYERCIERMEKVIEMEPNELRAYYYKGKALSSLNDDATARLVFDQALAKDPDENLKRLLEQALFNL